MHTTDGFLGVIRELKKRTRLLLRFVLHYKRYLGKKSFYPEKEHKSKSEIFKDFVIYILKYGEIDYSYHVLGIDVKGVNHLDYISYQQFMARRDRLNMIRRDCRNNAEPANYSCILRDKSLFTIMGNYWKMPVVNDLAKIVNKQISESEYNSVEELLEANPHVFIKPIDGQKGENVFSIDYTDDVLLLNGEEAALSEVVAMIEDISSSHPMLVQNRILQHPDVMAFHKASVNTIRVVTINHLHSSNPDDIVVVGSELRVGCGGNHTDNVSAGGIKIGVNKNGTLMEYGFYDAKHGTKTAVHPDSGIVFLGYKLPFYDETIQLCKEFHSKLKEIHLIGWDIAITEKGPVFVEGNESCGTDFQVMFGPMKDFYDKYLPFDDSVEQYVFVS